MKAKPTMKKAKAKKGKKVQARFKGIKKAKVTKYQVMIGKKKFWVKKATTTNKLVKSKFLKNKKLKKGKKAPVKVRAQFTFKHNGKTQKYWSKWSKVKKVKVK